jgi:spermidine synthase
MDFETLKNITRTFLAVFPEGAAYLAHYSLKAPIVGLVANLGANIYPVNWLEGRVRDATLAQRLRELRLHTDFNLFGCFLGGAADLRRFAGAGPFNTDDQPVVTYQAPRFAYANTEPLSRGLLVLIDLLKPAPEQVFSFPQNSQEAERHRRLAGYWTARDQFLKVGVGIKENDDVRQLVSQVKEPLLAIVRQSPDFDAAYNPLLAMAYRLSKIHPKEAEQLLVDLERANPYREDAKLLRIKGTWQRKASLGS